MTWSVSYITPDMFLVCQRHSFLDISHDKSQKLTSFAAQSTLSRLIPFLGKIGKILVANRTIQSQRRHYKYSIFRICC